MQAVSINVVVLIMICIILLLYITICATCAAHVTQMVSTDMLVVLMMEPSCIWLYERNQNAYFTIITMDDVAL